MDHTLGMPVILNDKIRGNTIFFEKIRISVLKITSLRPRQASKMNVDNLHYLRKIHFDGLVYPHWISTQLPLLNNLTSLIISIPTLRAIDLLQFEHTVPIFLLPVLQEFTIEAEKMRLVNLPRMIEDAISCGKNLSYLLDALHCPKLKTFKCFYKPPAFSPNFNYMKDPLKNFVQRHGNILETLSLAGFIADFPAEQNQVYPKTLQNLSIRLSVVRDGNWESARRTTKPSFWQDFLCSQNDLKKLEFSVCHYTWRWEIITQMITNNTTTLTTIRLFTDWINDDIIDFSIFSQCVNAKHFTFTVHVGSLNRFRSRRHPRTINADRLPQNLETIMFSDPYILTEELFAFPQRYKKLKTLLLRRVGTTNAFGVTEAALWNLIAHTRTLEDLNIVDFNGFFHCDYLPQTKFCHSWYGALLYLEIGAELNLFHCQS